MNFFRIAKQKYNEFNNTRIILLTLLQFLDEKRGNNNIIKNKNKMLVKLAYSFLDGRIIIL